MSYISTNEKQTQNVWRESTDKMKEGKESKGNKTKQKTPKFKTNFSSMTYTSERMNIINSSGSSQRKGFKVLVNEDPTVETYTTLLTPLKQSEHAIAVMYFCKAQFLLASCQTGHKQTNAAHL